MELSTSSTVDNLSFLFVKNSVNAFRDYLSKKAANAFLHLQLF